MSFCVYKHTSPNGKVYIGITSKPVLQLDACGNIIQAYLSISSAAMQLNIDGGDIGRCCKGKRKTAGGFVWEFAYQE